MMNDIVSFADRLRSATKADHESAENSGFITSLLEGRRSGADYVRLLVQYAYIYEALEAGSRALRRNAGPDLRALLDVRLDRMPSLRSDLKLLLPVYGVRVPRERLAATREYVARLEQAAAGSRPAFLAHHYLRYLGDLSGGRIMGQLVGRHYDVPPEMLSMWRFNGIGKPKPYKDGYRAALNAVMASPAEQQVFIDEVARGFGLNRALFEELDRRYPANVAGPGGKQLPGG
ncbi:biliverdin-producing heme oxygenase [Arthrobacter mobilis]|uniref:Biliverdin-producing heme oxygenase n=1 Tax=Arthrobacter mobilis TaxID=2724944 RepID=A0A7X6K785_9MICC|nr:biliverdin-producing heme oxygenase [Arthrobacter mobilis]NKX56441.1 biliverdin-producing heme oxygenase [Arthrobacter mobilis]